MSYKDDLELSFASSGEVSEDNFFAGAYRRNIPQKLMYTRQAQALTPPAPWAGAAFWRYALAVAAVAAGAALHAGLEAWGGGRLPRFITFYPAVTVVAVRPLDA